MYSTTVLRYIIKYIQNWQIVFTYSRHTVWKYEKWKSNHFGAWKCLRGLNWPSHRTLMIYIVQEMHSYFRDLNLAWKPPNLLRINYKIHQDASILSAPPVDLDINLESIQSLYGRTAIYYNLLAEGLYSKDATVQPSIRHPPLNKLIVLMCENWFRSSSPLLPSLTLIFPRFCPPSRSDLCPRYW